MPHLDIIGAGRWYQWLNISDEYASKLVHREKCNSGFMSSGLRMHINWQNAHRVQSCRGVQTAAQGKNFKQSNF